jgi:hypothetical protein
LGSVDKGATNERDLVFWLNHSSCPKKIVSLSYESRIAQLGYQRLQRTMVVGELLDRGGNVAVGDAQSLRDRSRAIQSPSIVVERSPPA